MSDAIQEILNKTSNMNEEHYLKEISFLKLQLDKNTNATIQLEKENKMKDNLIQAKNQEITEIKKKFDNLNFQLGSNISKITELAKFNESLKSTNNSLIQNNINYENLVNQLKSNAERIENQLTLAQKSNLGFKNLLKKKEDEISDLSLKNLESSKNQVKLEIELENLKLKNKENEIEIKSLIEKFNNSQNRNLNFEKFKKDSEKEYSDNMMKLNNQLIILNQETFRLKNELESKSTFYEKKIEFLTNTNLDNENRIKIKDSIIQEYQQEIDKYQKDQIQRDRQNLIKDEICRNQENEIKKKIEIILELKQKLNEFKNFERKYEKENLTNLKDPKIILSDMKKVLFENEELKNSIKAVNEKYENERNKCLNYQEKIEKLEKLEKQYENQIPMSDSKIDEEYINCIQDNKNLVELCAKLSAQNKNLLFNLEKSKRIESFEITGQLKEAEEYLYQSIEELESKILILMQKEIYQREKLEESEVKVNYSSEETNMHIARVQELLKENENLKEINKCNEKFIEELNVNSTFKFRIFSNSGDNNLSNLSDLYKIEAKNKEFENNINIIKKENENLYKDIRQSNDSIKELTNKLEIKNKDCYQKEVELNELKFGTIPNLQNVLDSKNKFIEESLSKINELKDLKESISKLSIENFELKNKLKLKENELSSVEIKTKEIISELETENKKLKSLIESLPRDEKFINLQNPLLSKNFFYESIQEQYHKLIQKLKEDICGKDLIIKNKDHEIQDLKYQKENFLTLNSHQIAKINSLENEILGLKCKTTISSDSDLFTKDITKKYHEKIKSENSLNEKLKGLNFKIKNLELLNSELITKNNFNIHKHLLTRIEELNQLNDQTKNLQIEADSQKKEIEFELCKKVVELDVITNKLKESEKNINNLKSELENTKRKIYLKDELIQNLQQNTNFLKEKETQLQLQDEKCKKLSNEIIELNNTISKLINEKSITNDELIKSFSLKEKKLKENYELKIKETADSKKKEFESLFASLKKAKLTIETLTRLEKSLSEKLKLFDETKISKSLIDEEKIKVNYLENQINTLKNKNKELENQLEDKNKKYNNEIEAFKIREEKLINDIKTMNNIQNDGNQNDNELKKILDRLIKYMYTATNLINSLEKKEASMEKEIESLRNDVLKSAQNCESCKALKEKADSLNETVSVFRKQITNEKNESIKINSNLLKMEIENEILQSDCKLITKIVQSYPKNNNIAEITANANQPLKDEKNKSFNILLSNLKKSTKLINVLMEETKNLNMKIDQLTK